MDSSYICKIIGHLMFQLSYHTEMNFSIYLINQSTSQRGLKLNDRGKMKSLRGKPRSIMFLGFNSLLSQQAAGN
jgi:hypothetical protein